MGRGCCRERLQLGWEGAMALQRAQPGVKRPEVATRARHGAPHLARERGLPLGKGDASGGRWVGMKHFLLLCGGQALAETGVGVGAGMVPFLPPPLT